MTVLTSSHSPTAATKFTLFARDIKISHTIFAMPWALLATVMAWKASGGGSLAFKLVLILVCMIAARTFAMTANRVLDANLDAKNPRTAGRAIPSGRLSIGFFAIVAAACVIAFFAATSGFFWKFANPWPLILATPVLLFLAAYPLLKRFTRFCHYYLGAALALAPVCAWLAVAGRLALAPLLMAGAVLCWTAGFDIIYACQDYASDIECGVFSIPAELGVARALWVSRLTHVLCAVLLIALGIYSPLLGRGYFAGVAIAIVLLAVEQSLVRPGDLSKANLAFFTVNGIISVLVGALGILDVIR